jgi:hypothetical protein
LQHEVEHLQELIPQEPEEPKEDPEEIEGMSGVEDGWIIPVVILSRIPRIPHSLTQSFILSS